MISARPKEKTQLELGLGLYGGMIGNNTGLPSTGVYGVMIRNSRDRTRYW